MITKGGITGLPANDFHKRQKSGDWSINEHFDNINYIRMGFTPNNYLMLGNYETDKILIYDIFNNQVSSLTKSITGTDLPSISCVAYNKTIGHLAIGLNKAPYLRVFNTSVGDLSEFEISEPYPNFIKEFRFRYRDLSNNVLHVIHNLNNLLPASIMLTNTSDISYPHEIEIINENQVDFIFHEAPKNILGTVYIYSNEKNTVHSLDSLISSFYDSDEDYMSYRLDLTDNDHVDPNFQIYDASNKMIFPTQIQEIDVNNVYDIIFPSSFDITDVRILVIQGYETHSESFVVDSDHSPVLINHKLFSNNISFQVFEESTGLVVYPSNINIQDKNNILISTDMFTISGTYKINISIASPAFVMPTPYLIYVTNFGQTNLVDNVLHVKHDLDDLLPASIMLTNTADFSYPYEIQIIDENHIDFIFYETPKNISGTIYIYSYEKNSIHSLDSLTIVDYDSDGDYTSYQLDITDNDHVDPNFQIYDTSNKMIFPTQIQEIVINNIYNIIFPSSFDITDVRILVIQGYETHSESFVVDSDHSPVLINHELLSNYLSFQVFEESTGLVVYPSNINIQDKSNVLISTDMLTVSGTYKINISASSPDFIAPEFIIGNPPTSMVTCLEFDSVGDELFVGLLKPNSRDSNILEFDTTNYVRTTYLDPLLAVPTDIKFDWDDKYLFIGHYATSLVDRNCTLYNYQTKEIINDYDFSTLKNLTTDSVTCACFITDQSLLVLGSYYEPYLHFYNYVEKENVTPKYTSLISNNVISRVKDLIKTKDDQYLLIALDNSPYLVVLDLVNNKINNLSSDLFVSSITSISLSVNDTYLCVTQRDDPYVTVFEFSTSSITPITLNYTPTTPSLSSTFFFGPVSSES
ncbi:hypothetical protein HN385_07400 [archaeon]|jgi:hypothetical protein|nr:hypothetical protein [archaeon]